MNLEYRQLIPANFSPDSKVWVYQASRLFTLQEALEIEEILKTFSVNWLSHGVKVKGAAHLFFGQFIILIADETATGVSGCSTDSSVRIMKQIENRFAVNMFDRNTLAFVVKDKIELLPLSQLQYALDKKFISTDTLYFNNLVLTKEELEYKWIIPVKESWLTKKVTFANPDS